MSTYTPSAEWIRIAVGYAKTVATDRTLPKEAARQEGYKSFDRWRAAYAKDIAVKVLEEIAAEVESSKPVQDGSELRQWMTAGIDRALFRINQRATEYRNTEPEEKP